ncbi:MAG: hypothetical protein LUF04_12255 [Bacteroides sp.]|nr:hypothetical protein [Bacteroides sp.]
MKNNSPTSRLVLIAEICGAAVAIGLFCFQLFVSKEETDTNPWLHGIQICMVSIAAVAAIIVAAAVIKDKKKSKK